MCKLINDDENYDNEEFLLLFLINVFVFNEICVEGMGFV